MIIPSTTTSNLPTPNLTTTTIEEIKSLRTTLNALIILLYNNGVIKLEDLEERERFINLLNKEDIK